MRAFGEAEQAIMRSQFRHMYRDIGYLESLVVLEEILVTASLLCEVLADERKKESEGMES